MNKNDMLVKVLALICIILILSVIVVFLPFVVVWSIKTLLELFKNSEQNMWTFDIWLSMTVLLSVFGIYRFNSKNTEHK